MDLNHARLPFRHTRVAREQIVAQGRERDEVLPTRRNCPAQDGYPTAGPGYYARVGAHKRANETTDEVIGMTRRLNALDWIALALVVIGGINWGLVGLFQFDLVAEVFGGSDTILARIVYIAVAVSAVFVAIDAFTFEHSGERRMARAM